MAKSGMERISSLTQLAHALVDIVKAAATGSPHAVILESVKHFWPYILAAAVILLLLPIIIMCSLPVVMFGRYSSNDPELAAITALAEAAQGYYDRYPDYCEQRVAWITETVTAPPEEGEPEIAYTVNIQGKPMDIYWFTALHAVSVQNDVSRMTEDSIRSFVDTTIPYTVEIEEPTEEETTTDKTTASATTTAESAESTASESLTGLLTITYLTPEQTLDACHYSEADRNWVHVMVEGLTNGKALGTAGFASPFPDTNWRDYITSDFGMRIHPITGVEALHKGVDIGMPYGMDIHAVSSGTVEAAGYSGSYGNYILLDHGAGLKTLYAHCSILLVETGQEVETGTVVAQVGASGNVTGAHCHLEVQLDGEPVDPKTYLP